MKLFRFVKKVFFLGLTILSNFTNALDCMSMKNQECKIRPEIININKNNTTKWHEKCKCECRLDANACNNKQRWNEDKCRCECKELIDKSVCDKGFIWNPSNCECKCDQSCDIGEYLNYSN